MQVFDSKDASAGPSALDQLLALGLRRWRFLLLVGFAGAFLGALSSKIMPKTYRASTLVSVEEGESLQLPSSLSASALGDLAALAGLPAVSGQNRSYALAILQSTSFIDQFVRDNGLTDEMFGYVNGEPRGLRRWLGIAPPTIRESVRRFREDALEISEDRRTGLVTVSLIWPNRDRVHLLTNMLIDRVNDLTRTRRIRESETRVAAIEAQLEQTNAVTVRAALLSLLEQEIKMGTLAQTKKDFSLVVLDPAQPADERDRVGPRPIVWAFTSGAIVGAFSLMLIFVSALRRRTPRA